MTPLMPSSHSSARDPGSTSWYHSAVVTADPAGARLGTTGFLHRIDATRWIPAATAIFAVLGAVLRLREYLFNRSLWFDETLIALNIIGRPVSRLVPPLDNHQGAPFGFLLLEKAMISAFGTSEYALRLVPLLSGLAALVLMYQLARRSLTQPGALVSVGLFAVSSLQIGYSTDLKPYSTDAALALLITLVALDAARALSTRNLIVLSEVGAVAVWFSYPAAFVLAGIGLPLFLTAVMTRQWLRAARLAVVGVVWLISLGACYWLTLRPVASDPWVFGVWSDAFLPWPPSYWTLDWILGRIFGIFHQPVGMTLSGLGALAFVAGMMRDDSDWRMQRWLLVSPLLVAFAAAALHRYPFDGRFLNFAVPSVLVVVGAGAASIMMATRRTAPVVACSLVALMFVHPLWTDAYDAVRPQGNEEIRPVLDYVRQHKQPNDALYLYWRTEPAFAYYADLWNNDPTLTSGRLLETHWKTDATGPGDLDTLEEAGWAGRTTRFQRDLDLFRGQSRVWLVFYHVKVQDGRSEEEWFRERLNSMGTERDHVSMPGASAYLYDLSSSSVHQTG